MTIGYQPKFASVSVIFGAFCGSSGSISMYARSAAKASSASVPTKHEPGSTSANSVREETSSRASVRRSMPIVSRTNQWLACFASVSSICFTAAVSPSVRSSQMPMSSTLVRIDRIASSSSRAICSGHQAAPAATIASTSAGCAPCGAFTVKVAVRRVRSICTSTKR